MADNDINYPFDFRPLPIPALSESFLEIAVAQTRKVMWNMVDYRELMMRYTCAMKEVRTKFDVLNTEFKVRYQRNPIASISTRLKSTSSLMEKLQRTGSPFSVEGITENIQDVAGVRIVCSYIDDIYRIADAFLAQDDITLLRRKDYIQNPKPSGYRSLHLIVTVPVFFAESRQDMTVEVQIRTIAMDFWASLDHQLKYKQGIDDQQEIAAELVEMAETITATDTRMMEVRRHIEALADTPDEDDILLEKLQKFDLQMD